MTEAWAIEWFICRMGPGDVKLAKSKGNKGAKIGDEMWRVPVEIGPISFDHNHWAGWHLTGEPKDHQLVAYSPVMQDALLLATELIDWMSKYIGQMAPRQYSTCYADLNSFGIAVQQLRVAGILPKTKQRGTRYAQHHSTPGIA